MAEPLDTLESVVNVARMRLNDMIAAAGGDVLTDTQPFTLVAINSAWRKLQEFLSKLGFLRFKNEVILPGLAAVSGTDPALQPYLNWSGSFNGSALDGTLVFPSDFIAPIAIAERINGSGSGFLSMDFLPAGLPLIPKRSWNNLWTWRNETVWIPGSLVSMDLWIRYWSFAVDFVAASTTAFSAQKVPIMRCQDAFALYLVAEISGPRGDVGVQGLVAEAEAAATILVSRENPSVLAAAQQAAPPPGA